MHRCYTLLLNEFCTTSEYRITSGDESFMKERKPKSRVGSGLSEKLYTKDRCGAVWNGGR